MLPNSTKYTKATPTKESTKGSGCRRRLCGGGRRPPPLWVLVFAYSVLLGNIFVLFGHLLTLLPYQQSRTSHGLSRLDFFLKNDPFLFVYGVFEVRDLLHWLRAEISGHFPMVNAAKSLSRPRSCHVLLNKKTIYPTCYTNYAKMMPNIFKNDAKMIPK